jgi:hypothetical protein
MAWMIGVCLQGSGAIAFGRIGANKVYGAFVRPLVAGSCRAARGMCMSATAAGTKDRVITGHPANNVPQNLAEKIGRDLHRIPNHPLGIIKDK